MFFLFYELTNRLPSPIIGMQFQPFIGRVVREVEGAALEMGASIGKSIFAKSRPHALMGRSKN